MRARIWEWLGKLAVASFSLLLALTFLELVVFGMVLKPDDVLPNVTVDSVVRYQPNTRAVFRHPDGTQSLATINADGWNSPKRAYSLEKTPGRLRIAVIGDSYVHAKFVDVGRGFPEVLETNLKRAGLDVEVYRFGMDGAPLSQYLHMYRKEVARYEPDVVLVQLIHNDFDESYRRLSTRYASSFMKLARGGNGEVVEIPPADFRPGVADFLRNFATFRYLYYQSNLYLRARAFISRYFWGGNEDFDPKFIESAVDVRKITNAEGNRWAARYVLGELRTLSRAKGFKLAFAMDGVRDAIYAGKSPQDFKVGALNQIAREVAAELELPLLELHEVFGRDWATHKKRLEFPFDWHWNERGNRLVGDAWTQFLSDDPRLLGSMPRATNAGGHQASAVKPAQ